MALFLDFAEESDSPSFNVLGILFYNLDWFGSLWELLAKLSCERTPKVISVATLWPVLIASWEGSFLSVAMFYYAPALSLSAYMAKILFLI